MLSDLKISGPTHLSLAMGIKQSYFKPLMFLIVKNFLVLFSILLSKVCVNIHSFLYTPLFGHSGFATKPFFCLIILFIYHPTDILCYDVLLNIHPFFTDFLSDL